MRRVVKSIGLLVLLARGADAQAVAGAVAPDAKAARDQAIEQEFIELNELLDQVQHDFGAQRKFCAPDPGSVLAVRLTVFSLRFGIDPRMASPWAALRERAEIVLEGVGDSGHPETGAYQNVSAQMDRWTLLDILGRADEARAILASVSTCGADGCLQCTAEKSVVVNQRRSECAERDGDLDAALRWLHESALDLGCLTMDDPAHSVAGQDLLLARYGSLLLRTGHAEAGVLVLQDLVRTQPGSIGGRMARAELEARGALAGIDRARFLSAGTGGSASSACLVVAVWRTDDPASMRWIAVRLPLRAGDKASRTVAFDAAAFEEARAPLEDALKRWPGDLYALALLDGLPGGAESSVDAFLGSLDTREWQQPDRMQTADEWLRWMHGGGPDLVVPLGRCDGGALCREWRTWRRSTGRHAHSTH